MATARFHSTIGTAEHSQKFVDKSPFSSFHLAVVVAVAGVLPFAVGAQTVVAAALLVVAVALLVVAPPVVTAVVVAAAQTVAVATDSTRHYSRLVLVVADHIPFVAGCTGNRCCPGNRRRCFGQQGIHWPT